MLNEDIEISVEVSAPTDTNRMTARFLPVPHSKSDCTL